MGHREPAGKPSVRSEGRRDAEPAVEDDRPDPRAGSTELGIDIIRVARIRDTLERYGDRFTGRILTSAEAAYVRGRAETLAGRWAAKEAVSKVLGLGVRGIGWRDIEIERLPTGQPAVRLHGRAAARADQLGMGRIAVSISHEREFAIAIAHGIRTAGGRFLFPPDIDARLDEREAAILRRVERLRSLAASTAGPAQASPGTDAAGARGPVGPESRLSGMPVPGEPAGMPGGSGPTSVPAPARGGDPGT